MRGEREREGVCACVYVCGKRDTRNPTPTPSFSPANAAHTHTHTHSLSGSRTELDVSRAVQEEVACLEVAVYHGAVVEVHKGEQQLPRNRTDLCFLQPALKL